MNNTKILVGISVLLAFAFLTALFTTGFLLYERGQKQTNAFIQSTNTATGDATTGTTINPNPATQTITLNLAEITKHNNPNDCWLLINNKIYNVTTFLAQHPGGEQAILTYCGKEATQAFNTQGGQGSHSQLATSMLTDYYIGDLGATTNTPTQNTTTVTTNTQPQNNNNREEDEDDD